MVLTRMVRGLFARTLASEGHSRRGTKSSRRSALRHATMEALEPRLLMTTLYWDASASAGLQGGNGTWSTSVANWNTAADGSGSRVAWSNGADAVFSVDATSTITVSGGVTANSISFTGTGYTVTSSTITLTGSATVTANQDATINSVLAGTAGLVKDGSGKLIVAGSNNNSYTGGTIISAGALQLGTGGQFGTFGSGSVTNNGELIYNRNNSYTVSEVVSGTGSVTHAGTGTLVLTGANTYSGATSVGASSSLTVGNNNALGTGNVTVASGGRVILNNGITVTGNQITIAGLGASNSLGALQAGTGATATWAGNVLLGNAMATLGAQSNGTLTVSGVIADGAGSTLNISSASTGVVVLTGTNTYTGGTNILRGRLRLGASAALPTATLLDVHSTATTESATLDLNGFSVTVAGLTRSNTTGPGNVTNSSATAVTLTVDQVTAQTYGGTITGNLSLVKTGSGTLVLSGANTYTGTTTINNGVLQIGDGGTSGSLGTGAITNNANLTINRSSLTISQAIGGSGSVTQAGSGTTTLTGTNTYAGTTTITAGGLRIGSGATGTLGGGDVANNGTLTFGRTNAYSVSNVISGTGAVVHAGTGALTLAGVNTYSGGTTVNGAGEFLATNNASIGTGNVTVSSGRLVLANGLNMSAIDATIDGNGGNFGGALQVAANGSATWNGDIILGANSPRIGTQNNGTLTVNGVIRDGAGSALFISGGLGGTGGSSGTVVLNGANTYTGGTKIIRGTVRLGRDNALVSGGVVDFMNATASETATLDLNGFDQQFGGLARTGISEAIVTNSGATLRTLKVSQSSNTEFGGRITGTIAVRKAGTGELALSGSNTYVGPTIVEGGVLESRNGGTFGVGAITNDSVVRYNTSVAVSVGQSISGSGSVQKTGVGIVDLKGTNTFSGGLSITAGIVRASDSTKLGASTGTVTLNGGGLSVVGPRVGISQGVTIGSSGGTIAAGVRARFEGGISGSGTLGVAGRGIVDIGGTNSFSGSIQVNAGALQVSGTTNANIQVNSGGTYVYGSGGTTGDVTVNGGTVSPLKLFHITTGIMNRGEAGLSPSEIEENISNREFWILAPSWDIAILSGFEGEASSPLRPLESPLSISDTNGFQFATVAELIANYPGFNPGSFPSDQNTKVIAFEDGIDADFDDWFWTPTVEVFTNFCATCQGVYNVGNGTGAARTDGGVAFNGNNTSNSDVPGGGEITSNSLIDIAGQGAGFTDGRAQLLAADLPENASDPAFTVVTTNTSVEIFKRGDVDGSGNVSYESTIPGSKVTFVRDAATDMYTLTDADGKKLVFSSPSGTNAATSGQVQQVIQPSGQATNYTYNPTSKLLEESRTPVDPAGQGQESTLYTYYTSGAHTGKVHTVTLRNSSNGGATWSVQRVTTYTYYNTGESGGPSGYVKTLVARDSAGVTIDSNYYRYYTTNSSTGFIGALKYQFGSESYARLVGAGLSTNSSEAALAPYADVYFEYDSERRITKKVAQNTGCSTCTGGLGTYTYSYAKGNVINVAEDPNGFNTWHFKTVETRPDGTINTHYANHHGATILSVTTNTITNQQWADYYRYDPVTGLQVMHASPSAVTGFDEQYIDLVNFMGGNAQYVSDTTGLITVTSYFSTTTATVSSGDVLNISVATPGGAKGYFQSSSIRRGETGTSILQSSATYFGHQDASGAVTFVTAESTQYRNTNGTGARTTTYGYVFHTGTNQVEEQTVTLPIVSAAQNGSGVASVNTSVFDGFGRMIWSKDAEGFLTYMAYDTATGAVIKTITDVDTTQTSTFSSLPSGWTTPSGGGLHLTSTNEVDVFGRTTKLTDAKGNVTYTVYNDSTYETRTYRGWNSTTNQPTGPVEISRHDKARNYTETLTASWSSLNVTGGRPVGNDSLTLATLHTLSRTVMNTSGQIVQTLNYHYLTGVSYSASTVALGIAGTNYYLVSYGYDKMGRSERTVSATATITFSQYDALGRAVGTWIGTNDTPSTDLNGDGNTNYLDFRYYLNANPNATTGPTGTNMKRLNISEYDNGGVGDGNLTKSTQLTQDGSDNRVTTYAYDWRNRAVATKTGVKTTENASDNTSFITYSQFDNLGQTVASSTFDGDTLSITTDANSDGVPDMPTSSALRAYSTAEYDELGRAFKTSTHSVDPSTGTVSSSAIVSQSWFNQRGMTVKSSSSGQASQKMQYDGAGRITKSFVVDATGDSSWADALDLVGDTVLQQNENTYDANGNVILSTVRQRFHDATGTGELGNPSSTTQPKARVSYSAAYYDLADRLTDSVNVGTNGGSTYTRPSSVPSRSDTVLVTSYAYNAAGWTESVTDPKGLISKTFYDNLGRTTKTVENYVNGTPSDADDRTTLYTYDGAGHILTLTADMPSGQTDQTTEYVYGVDSASGSAIASNDLLRLVKYPNKSTGAASSNASDQNSFTYNALGQTLTKTDQHGTVHTYTFDILGRMVSDAVTIASGNPQNVDTSVLRIETTYNTQGQVDTITSYNAASGGSIVNQFKREYNGLGQMTREYQAHGGGVNTSTTPYVGYAYDTLANRRARLISMTYPNGKVLSYNYGTTSSLNDNISRLESISETGGAGTIESYEYLGAGTVVQRSQPQAGIRLSYIKLSSESIGDAGDQYTGLDRFGRVVDQRWLNSSDVSIDRYGYTYDRNSNRTSKSNALNSSFDEAYTYDGLNRLTDTTRGGSSYQSWSLDSLGNMNSVTTNSTTETRTHNSANQLTGMGSSTLTFDNNGNTTTDDNGNTLVYDAWNRLVSVSNGSTTIVSYSYDGATRRITETDSTDTKDIYYSTNWQIIEERLNSNTDVEAQYVWSPVYVDALVLRDKDIDNSTTFSTDERIFAMQDANFNVTGLVTYNTGTSTWAVGERFVNDPYGKFATYDANWTAASESFLWQHHHQGLLYSAATGLYWNRNRDYSPSQQRFIQQDPMGYVNGCSLFLALLASPTGRTDAWGLLTIGIEAGTDSKAKEDIVREFETEGPPVKKYSDAVEGMIKWVETINETVFNKIRDVGNVSFGEEKFENGKKDMSTKADYINLLKREKKSRIMKFKVGGAKEFKEYVAKLATEIQYSFDVLAVAAHGLFERGMSGNEVLDQVDVNGDVVNQTKLMKDLSEIGKKISGKFTLVSCFNNAEKKTEEWAFSWKGSEGSEANHPNEPKKCFIKFDPVQVAKSYGKNVREID